MTPAPLSDAIAAAVADPMVEAISDPIAAVTHPDPYPYYAALAQARPFSYHPGLKLWVAASAQAVAAVLDHPDARVRPPGQPVPPALAGSAAGDLFGRLVRMNDGAAHAALKTILLRQLGALDLARAQASAQALAAALPGPADVADMADLAHAGAHETNRWMFTLPVLTVAHLLGLPLSGGLPRDEHGHAHPRIAGLVGTFATAMSPLATPAEVQAGIAAAQWLIAHVDAQRATASPGGLLDVLARDARLAGIDAGTLVANAVGLMIQACEATAGLIGNTMLALGRGQADGADIDALVAQVAHRDPPVQNTRRFMAADAVVCGQAVKSGEGVLVLLAAAAHDPGRQAAECDEAGKASRAWTFGAGRHGCPGDALARTLAACTVRALLARGVRPAGIVRGVRYRPSVNARIPRFAPSAEQAEQA